MSAASIGSERAVEVALHVKEIAPADRIGRFQRFRMDQHVKVSEGAIEITLRFVNEGALAEPKFVSSINPNEFIGIAQGRVELVSTAVCVHTPVQFDSLRQGERPR